MGVYISGGMIVGCLVSEVNFDDEKYDDFYDWFEDHDMSVFSPYFDADIDDQVVGFVVKDVSVLSGDFDDWVSEVKCLSRKFNEITNINPRLIGMQDVY